MTRIHHTAIVDSTAILEEGCCIGPYCNVGPKVFLGKSCVLHSHVVLHGPCTIGVKNTFYPFCSIGQRTQDLKYEGEPTHLEIGKSNTFREGVTINRGTTQKSKTVIGNYSNFLAYSHVAHDCEVGNHIVFSNGATLAGHVCVEDHAVIGGLTAAHQFCRIGQHAIVGGCSKIVQDVPPFMIADGNPAEIHGINVVGLKRFGFGEGELLTLKGAFRILYRSNLNVQQALKRIRQEMGSSSNINTLISFITSSHRGIIR
ncbi:MAG: acyl-ACP--UDP-N-acetylglucosamine O-acyltransferase [Candidatus Xiphinematobacter sp.]|nr:MAG: acyl-ACP--UDP-N-acetylglucosamine O-acyltransferase [Candidatus Xiphinematobacter sp.]QQY09054.1 MAG: acyl-ACP--UDP-N-acetylglucosamine O-acyltransferase [Candidatus Xiphinematobacter sp.]QQY09797.1 MAG: acyl-ACP--UDP-N-acetylglucosamine O-acyltransferase [Candidatus Xiphinematobacter sp.]QQY10539.1 MAG: acyl-ACP--UDP-N-acetylglucosamine O-acyltransferase [Candidatus Xiphinematobacter sp.]QQY11276.1 MAG: acyl-ACP--UDP-N-acetylglucosamine O-acyltransferase [Candidatus Xiphinematobacter s